MSAMPFRFAMQAAPQDATSWLAMARRAEELGYSTLLMPDGMQLMSPLPALALAAGATTRLHVGTFVLASPLRAPALAAWDAHTLSVLSGGRFELGIGTGRPEVVEQSVRQAGQPPTTAAERLARVEQTIDALRALDADPHSPDQHAPAVYTPVLMAAAGPKARAVAAAKADIITLAISPMSSREEAAGLTAAIREEAGDRAGEIEFAMPIFAVGDEVPPWVQRFLQADFETLVERDSLMILRGSPRQMADELERRREILGVSYHSVNAAFCDEFASVVEMLAGR